MVTFFYIASGLHLLYNVDKMIPLKEQLGKLQELGWHLFPLNRDKSPKTKNGFKDASNDWLKILMWLKEEPDGNWGVATGASNLLAVDLDTNKALYRDSAIQEAIGEPLPTNTAKAQTGSGGFHLIYRSDPTLQFNQGKLPGVDCVDVFHRTGYLVLPPSLHPNGQRYRWILPPWEQQPLPAPAALTKYLSKPQQQQKKKILASDVLYMAKGTGRWEKCQSLAGLLRNCGFSEQTIYETLKSFVSNQCEYDESIADRKLRDLAQWAMKLPINNTLPPSTSLSTVKVVKDGKIREIPRSRLLEARAKGYVVSE